jgi:hypothetical protein
MEAQVNRRTQPNMARPMAYDYMNSATAPDNTVFPAQAGTQCHDKVQSSTNAQLDTRVREYDEAIASLKITVFPAQAGN